MVYKRVFCRTNYLKSVCDVVSSFWFVIKCQVPFSLKNLKCHHVDSSVITRSLSHLRLLIIVCTLLLCHFSNVGAIPTSRNALFRQSLIDTRIQDNLTYSNLNPNLNRVFRQAKQLENPTVFEEPRVIVGFKLEGDSTSIIDNGLSYTVKENAEVEIRMFGIDFTKYDGPNFLIGFSNEPPNADEVTCHVRGQSVASAKIENKHTALAKISLARDPDNLPYFLCYAIQNISPTRNTTTYHYASQDGESWFRIYSETQLMPLWLQLILIVVLLAMSGLFSGLNLGLMALDKNELQVIERCGTDSEKFWSRSISPVRKRGNYLLCTLLLGNVLVNSTLTILMDSLTSGVFAVIVSTLAIVIFGEIIPQALCSRHGLAVGAKTIYITYLFMGLTFPLSYPISLILDKILGEEIGNVYDRERLMEYIRVTKDYNRLEADEMNIISGALRFKNIRVVDVMTPIDDVFMLPYDTTLSFDTLTLINNSGYSRIPVFENERDNVVGILHVKDLSLIDTDHNLPLKVVLDFYSHPLFSVFEDVTLDVMLNEFKKGKSHMAMVRRVIDNGVTDPFYELLGVVTLEDIIEELIQAEINDETDVISDNRRKQKRKEVQGKPNYLDFIRSGFKKDAEHVDYYEHVVISPQLALATFRFLASSVEPFRPDYLSEEVLKILMAKNIYFEAKGENRKPNLNDMSPENKLYVRGEPADYFIMILEGRARIIVTKENQEYDAGPFCCFGISALANATGLTSNSFDARSEDRRSQIDEHFSADNSPNVASSPLNAADSTGSNPSMNPVKAPEVHFVPDFTLFCTEKTIYMKVTRKLYNTAIRTTEIEKQRTSSINKSLSGVAIGSDITDYDTRINMEPHALLPRELKSSQYLLDTGRFRKMSMSTNLPESRLFNDPSSLESSQNNIGSEDDKLVVSFQNTKEGSKPPINPSHKDNLKHSKSVPSDSLLKRSDAVDLLSEVPSDQSSPEEQIKMISLANESHNSDSSEINPKAGNGSLLFKSKVANPDQKSSDLDDHDETSKLI